MGDTVQAVDGDPGKKLQAQIGGIGGKFPVPPVQGQLRIEHREGLGRGEGFQAVFFCLTQNHDGLQGRAGILVDTGGPGIGRAVGKPPGIVLAQNRAVAVEDMGVQMGFPKVRLGGLAHPGGTGEGNGLTGVFYQ